jgi:hypothetical protein
MPPAFAQLKTAAKTGCLKCRVKDPKVQKIVVLLRHLRVFGVK